ncbi:DUF3177 family protein [Crocosphaera sp. XPORK-15E]|uniref:DUF3177 family protein n=1 Tax=Crocosphaera sp. XPORK-15E TaxID=3110247 RepID=UPI002B1EE1D4|nr:DUF3177 family protein [Crocosphaera sp. XPORK-15E]MEA5536591.1 DUF3177 family protein [Crocosphaera sp. XPORK-15E]
MEDLWFRPLIWIDYRLALLFNLIIPIILTIWAFARQMDAIGRLLVIYWRVASLLIITVYLMAPGWLGENTPFQAFSGQMGFVTLLAARILIPISLWFWLDLNDEIKDLPPSFLKLVLTSWRWAVTVYSSLGAMVDVPFLSCAVSRSTLETPFCQVWLQVPVGYWSIVHQDATPGFLGFLGLLGLSIYVLYLAYFLLVRLGKQGRSALEQ